MKFNYFIGFILLAALVMGCDSPTEGFERLNKNDPMSMMFEGKGSYNMELTVDSDRIITISWDKTEDFVERVVLKKSLGDTLNFEVLGNLKPTETQFSDSTGVIDRLIYYQIETFYTRNETEILYGSSLIEFKVGEILNFTFQVDNEREEIDLNWTVEVPLFNHFVIESDNLFSLEGDKTVQITYESLETTYSYSPPDIKFDTRNYTLRGIIEVGHGRDDIVVEKTLSIDLAAYHRPENFNIEVLNEQDWLLTWEGEPFYSEGVKLSKSTMYSDRYWFEVPEGDESLIDSVLSAQNITLGSGRGRSYRISFYTGDTESNFRVTEQYLDISTPYLREPNKDLSSVNSITWNWGVYGEDADKIKEFVIDKLIDGEFQEIDRVPGVEWQYTDNVNNTSERPVYRVRSLTTGFSEATEYGFVNNFKLINTLDTQFDHVQSIEISSNEQYLAALSSDRFGPENILLEIWDLNSGQKIQTFQSDEGGISDFKISHDDQFLYYSIPEKEAIFRANFPQGNDVTKVIENSSHLGDPVMKIDVSSNGMFLLGTGGNYFTKRWNLDTFGLQYTIHHPNSYASDYNNHIGKAKISGDDTKFAMIADLLYLKDVEDGKPIRTLSSDTQLKNVQFSSNDTYISSTNSFKRIFSVETGEYIRAIKGGILEFHPEKDHVLAFAKYVMRSPKFQNWVYLYDIQSGNYILSVSDEDFNRPASNISKIKFINSNRLAVADTPGKTIEIWKKTDSQQWKIIK